ncbi:MAG: hypothetical protein VX740_09610, partial [Pseudomonadota bacterium]|nr:hypothetical protein [Pseudomonadota bacterium]
VEKLDAEEKARKLEKKKDRRLKRLKENNRIESDALELGKMFAAVTDDDIIMALTEDNPLVLKSWKSFQVLNGSTSTQVITKAMETDGGKSLTRRLNDVSARVDSVTYRAMPFTEYNLENLFKKNKVKIDLIWDKDAFKNTTKRLETLNKM